MRASSWGDVGEYGRLLHAHEASSMHSGAGEHDEPLDPDVVVVGAGGVALGPLPPTPSGSAGVLAALGAPSSRLPHHGDATACHVPPQQQQVSSYSSEGDVDVSDGDSDSFFARNSEEAARGAAFSHAHAHLHHHPHPRVGHDDDDDVEDDGGWGIAKDALYGPHNVQVDVEEEECEFEEEEDEDEDEDGSDGLAIEVRRRRPSWAVHHDEHEGDDEDEEDDGPPPSPPQHVVESDGDEP